MQLISTVRRIALASALALAGVAMAGAAAPALACGPKTVATPTPGSVPATAQRTVIPVTGMSCGNCAGKIQTALMGIAGVYEVQVSVDKAWATVAFDAAKVTPEQLAAAIKAAGYTPGAPQPAPKQA